MSKNVFKEIEESSKGEAFKGMCEIAHAFMKKERLNAEVEIKNFLDRNTSFSNEERFSSVDQVIQNGINWYMIDYLYEKGSVHYLVKNNQFLEFGQDDIFIEANLRYRRMIDNGRSENDAMNECMEEAAYANEKILRACDQDKEGLGKVGYEIFNKGNKAVYYFITGTPNDEFSLKNILKEIK